MAAFLRLVAFHHRKWSVVIRPVDMHRFVELTTLTTFCPCHFLPLRSGLSWSVCLVGRRNGVTARARSKYLKDWINGVKCPTGLPRLDSSVRKAPLSLPRYLDHDHHRDLHQREIETEDVTPAWSNLWTCAASWNASSLTRVWPARRWLPRRRLLLDPSVLWYTVRSSVLPSVHPLTQVKGHSGATCSRTIAWPSVQKMGSWRVYVMNHSLSWMRRSSSQPRHWHTGFCPKSLT